MTSPDARSGTERVHEVSNQVAADVYVNVQGDEPLARQEHLDALVALMQDASIQVGTLKTPIPEGSEDIHNPNAVKVVTDSKQRALYFSRATIPFDRDKTGAVHYFKHLGFYAYRKPALDQFVKWPESSLERSERLEQLRFLENGIGISVARDAVRYGGGGHRRRSAKSGEDPKEPALVCVHLRLTFSRLRPQRFVSKLPDVSGRTIPRSARARVRPCSDRPACSST